jgi:hypothetical protein
MTERYKDLNRRRVRIGRTVEAHMTLICGKVVLGLSAADFDHPARVTPQIMKTAR